MNGIIKLSFFFVPAIKHYSWCYLTSKKSSKTKQAHNKKLCTNIPF